MFFSVKADKFSGIMRGFKNKGYPKVELLPSSISEGYPADNVLDFNDQNSHWASDRTEELNAHFDVKIVSGVLRITNYSIRSHCSNSNYIQAWTLEGSNDNINYVILDDRPQNADLKSNGIGQYPANSENNYYQYFRIKQTMKTSYNEVNMRIANLDFYGEFLPFKLKSCRCYNNRNFYFVTLVVLIINY